MSLALRANSTVIDRLSAFFDARNVEVYVVGGLVRDRLMGRAPSFDKLRTDIDLAVKGDVVTLSRELADELGGSLAPLSVPRGMMRVVAPPDDGAVDGSALRQAQGESVEPLSNHIDLSGYSGDIKDDLARRDFTVNAMAVSLAEWNALRQAQDGYGGRVIDLFGGRGDLFHKAIRSLNSGVFADDPGRLLRAVRLSGELGFRIEPDTVRQLMLNSHLMERVSADRVRDEFLRILAPTGARARLEALDQLGLLRYVIPELMATKGVEQPRMHYWDVWGHSLHTVQAAEGVTGGHQNSPVFSCVPWTPETEAYFAEVVSDGHTRRTILKLAALLHDIAKPQTKTVEPDGRTRFFGHSEQGAEVAERRLSSLRLSNRGASMVSRMVLHHLRPSGLRLKTPGGGAEWPSDKAIYRYFRDTSDIAIDTLYLALADYLGAKGPELAHPDWLEHAKMIAHILDTGGREPVAVSTSRLVNGHDLMSSLRLQPGPHIGALLDAIEEARASGEIETQEQALELAADTLARQASGFKPGRDGTPFPGLNPAGRPISG